MQITIKTLKNSVFKIESELDVDVADFKKKVEEHDKECPQAQQKLIYQVQYEIQLRDIPYFWILGKVSLNFKIPLVF